MATYYLRTGGNNGSAGTSPATAWATWAKLTGAAGFSSGDTCHVGGGRYAETITFAMTSAVAETFILGDPTGANTGDVGEVILTAYTTGDAAAPAAGPTIEFAGRDYITMRNVTVVGGSSNVANCMNVSSASGASTNMKWEDCCFVASHTAGNPIAVKYGVVNGTAANSVFDRCEFINAPVAGTGGLCVMATNTVGGSDTDVNIQVRNCIFWGRGVALLPDGAANTFKPYGVDIINCTAWTPGGAFVTASTNWSTASPCNVFNCRFLCGQTAALVANGAGQIVENYNEIWSGATAHTNVTTGANTRLNTSCPPFEFGRYRSSRRLPPAHPLESIAGAQQLAGDGVSHTATDWHNLTRPYGQGNATIDVGAFGGKINTFAKESTTYYDGSSAISCTGPAVHEFRVALNAAATTITVRVQWDATYAGTKPLIKLVDGDALGFSDQTATATGASGQWELLTINVTPTAAGMAKLRLVSSDTNGAGRCYADALSITAVDMSGFTHFMHNGTRPLTHAYGYNSASAGGGGNNGVRRMFR